jgi:plastocyanin
MTRKNLGRRRSAQLGAALALLSVLAVSAGFALAGPSSDLTGRVTVLRDGSPKKDRSDVVLYLRGVPDALPDTSKLVSRVYQRDKQFTPSVSVALLGSSVEFPNEDKIFHNVFSLSKAARFDLGLYKEGTSRTIKAKKTGVIDVFCNIHPQMAAKVVVLDTKYYAQTGPDGSFRIKGVPPGSYELVAWQPRGKEVTQRVTVRAGAATDVAVSLTESSDRERHVRKDGTPYGRYE